jgi:hypothetical protein
MNGRHLLDTNIIIAALASDASVLARIDDADECFVSIVVLGEMLYVGSLAPVDMDHATSGIDVADLEVEPFLHPQAERVDGPEVNGHPLGVGGLDNLEDLLASDDLGERLDVLQFHLLQGLPIAFAGSRVEELDSRVGDPQGAVGVMEIILHVEKESPELVLGDLVRRGLAEVGQFADGPQVPVVRSLAHSAQVEVFGHAGVEGTGEVRGRCHRRCSLLKGEAKKVNKDRME